MICEFRGGAGLAVDSGDLRLIAPLDFGPRILFLGKPDGENLLEVFEEEKGAGPDGDYYFRGGHRLWHAPEDPVRTYQPDNYALEGEEISENAFLLRAPVEARTGIRKEVEIRGCGNGTFRIGHRLRNEGLWPVRLAPWALTVFRPGGIVVAPFPAKGEHPRDLLPSFGLVPWDYTDFGLSGWDFGSGFVGLDTRRIDCPQKLGISAGYPGWLGYWREGTFFVKSAERFLDATYPDRGCAAEFFSDGKMAELETLGPLKELAPGEIAEHVEEWTVLENVSEPADDAVWEKEVLPAVRGWLEERRGVQNDG